MKKFEAYENAIEFLKGASDSDILDLMSDLDSWNGYLGDNRFFEMEMLPEFYSGKDLLEVLNRAYYGHDENFTNDAFNPNREYFSFNAYGNLVSADEWFVIAEYKDLIDEYFIDEIVKERGNLSANILADDEFSELLDLIEADEFENDEGE